jgi:magnesium chelatase family protein
MKLRLSDLSENGGRYGFAVTLGILAPSGQVDPQALLQYRFLDGLCQPRSRRPEPGASFWHHRAIRPHRRWPSTPMYVRHTPCWNAALGRAELSMPAATCGARGHDLPLPNLADVSGQAHARRTLEVPVVRGHNLLT